MEKRGRKDESSPVFNCAVLGSSPRLFMYICIVQEHRKSIQQVFFCNFKKIIVEKREKKKKLITASRFERFPFLIYLVLDRF